MAWLKRMLEEGRKLKALSEGKAACAREGHLAPVQDRDAEFYCPRCGASLDIRGREWPPRTNK